MVHHNCGIDKSSTSMWAVQRRLLHKTSLVGRKTFRLSHAPIFRPLRRTNQHISTQASRYVVLIRYRSQVSSPLLRRKRRGIKPSARIIQKYLFQNIFPKFSKAFHPRGVLRSRNSARSSTFHFLFPFESESRFAQRFR